MKLLNNDIFINKKLKSQVSKINRLKKTTVIIFLYDSYYLTLNFNILPNVIKNIRVILSINFEIKNIEAYITNQDIPLFK